MFLAASESRANLVDIDVPTGAWVGLGALILVLLAADLYRHRDDHEPSPREALTESLVWVMFGLSFGGLVLWGFGSAAFGEYMSGYVIEKSLSVDNVFVWSMLFTSMAIPLKFQHRVLFWGIFGALVLRGIFIFVGSALINRFFWLLIVFGVFLILTGIRVLRHTSDESDGTRTTGLALLRRFLPVTEEFDGHRFLTVQNGKRAATPLLAALVVVELTDVIFAVDSVPAILAVSNEPFLIFASNAFAILGLRAMYFLLANARERFHYLSHGLGAILIFVGLKMTVSEWFHVNTYLSLGAILALLVIAIFFSERRARQLAALSSAPADDTTTRRPD